jgi:hypothetical protein
VERAPLPFPSQKLLSCCEVKGKSYFTWGKRLKENDGGGELNYDKL